MLQYIQDFCSKSRNAGFVGIRADFSSVFRLDKKLTPEKNGTKKVSPQPAI